ncbi:hypothetical protein QFZ73_003399 [Peribacillus sp. V2I11]|nr:hypothetical protein [Peribacillus sp. V2I11]
MILYEDGIRYLIYVDSEVPAFPLWYPAELFEVSDNTLPDNWHYKFNGIIDGAVSAIWRYEELVFSDSHFDGLGEQDVKDIGLFLKRKKEMYDKMY